MCYQLVYLIFDFASEASLKDAAAMNRCAAAVAERTGWPIEGDASKDTAWSAALGRGGRSIYLAYDPAPAAYGITLSVVTNQWRRLYVGAYRGGMQSTEYGQKLVAAGEAVYETLAPDYGYGLISLDTQLLDPPGEGDFIPKMVHDYSFFSPRLVKKFAALSAVPTTRSVDFNDGGTLLELSSAPLARIKTETANYLAATAILGIPKFQQGC